VDAASSPCNSSTALALCQQLIEVAAMVVLHADA
jgi:hypothetical protein